MSWAKIAMDKDNRMLRIGIGIHNGLWFFRIDLWWYGFRLATTEVFK